VSPAKMREFEKAVQRAIGMAVLWLSRSSSLSRVRRDNCHSHLVYLVDFVYLVYLVIEFIGFVGLISGTEVLDQS